MYFVVCPILNNYSYSLHLDLNLMINFQVNGHATVYLPVLLSFVRKKVILWACSVALFVLLLTEP